MCAAGSAASFNSRLVSEVILYGTLTYGQLVTVTVISVVS